MRRSVVISLYGFLLSSCASGLPSDDFVNPNLSVAYIALSATEGPFIFRAGTALVVAPGVAVTNAHNRNLVPEDAVLAESRDYDLLYFRTERGATPRFGVPSLGQGVIAYGQATDGSLREAAGHMRSLTRVAPPRCDGCAPQPIIMFDAMGGAGFSGGPVVSVESGDVVGIVFGYRDTDTQNGTVREMYAYDIDVVLNEMGRLLEQ